jgi:DNA-binding GntR family transcriptional regulator
MWSPARSSTRADTEACHTVGVSGASELSASDRAYGWTRSRILDGRLGGGSMINEGDVSAAVGVSRTPVREAFLRLASEGMLRLFPKRGALVLPVTPSDMRDVMEARLLVEPWAVAVVARLTDRGEVVAKLRSAIDTLEGRRAADDQVGYQEADRAFHEIIVAATSNSLVEGFYRTLRDRQLRMGAAAIGVGQGRPASILNEHREILHAIEEGDAARARAVMGDHIANTRDALELKLRAFEEAPR